MAVKIIVSNSSQPTIGKVFLGNLPIAMAYLGNKLIFNGEQWLNCIVSLDSLYLQTKDGYKIQPKMEA